MINIFLIILIALLIGNIIYCVIKYHKLIKNSKSTDKELSISFLETLNLTGLPIITFNQNNTKINFILDTGSTTTILDSRSIKKLKLKYKDLNNDNNIIVDVNGKETKKITYHNMSMSYKKMLFNFDFIIKNCNYTFYTIKKNYGVTVHGILGSDFLDKYNYILDFNEYIAYPINENKK